jgi:alkanesulfonate monooxygenase SsuD/methylene tetrahydromethanopterin reductase-like flavin-dependent oxidoreductase (luciferase family)
MDFTAAAVPSLTRWFGEPDWPRRSASNRCGSATTSRCQQPHPPIVVGGHSPAAFRRAIQHGNGWYGWDLDVTQTAHALAGLREAESRHGRPAGLGELEITITPSGSVDLDTARRYADLGVHRLAIQPRTMDGTAIDELITMVGETLVGRV